MAEFNIACNKTDAFEGLYSINKNDKGGETYKGIARKKHPGWKGWPVIDSYKKQAESIDELNELLEADQTLQHDIYMFYLINYWDALKLSLIKEQILADLLYDIAVNMGTGVAAEFLQSTINIFNRNEHEKFYKDIKVDRNIGPKTIAAYEKARPQIHLLILTIACDRHVRYKEIMERDPSQEIFIGWFIRSLKFFDEYNEWLRAA